MKMRTIISLFCVIAMAFMMINWIHIMIQLMQDIEVDLTHLIVTGVNTLLCTMIHLSHEHEVREELKEERRIYILANFLARREDFQANINKAE